MIVRTDANTSHFSNINDSNQNIPKVNEVPISGESNIPMTLNEYNNNVKVENIKDNIENGSYKMDLDSTSKKMAQELLQK